MSTREGRKGHQKVPVPARQGLAALLSGAGPACGRRCCGRDGQAARGGAPASATGAVLHDADPARSLLPPPCNDCAVYELRYFNIADQAEDEDEDEE